MITLYSTRALDRLFNDVWNNTWEAYTPSYNSLVRVKDGVATVSYEVPGIPKNKLNVSWKNDVLSITGKHEERSVSYKVSMVDIDTSTLRAECHDGILTVSANLQKEEDGVVTVTVV